MLKAAEGELQTALEEMYASMNEETFRAMRRIMPVKRTKMEWNVNAVRMNKQVRK
jgi:capping protein alpha